MTIKLEAAYHEAGHAIMAFLSKYHSLVWEINLAEYGAGSASIALSRSKLIAESLAEDVENARVPEIVKDLVLILVSGLVSEQIAAGLAKSLAPNKFCAEPDHKLAVQQLKNARPPLPNKLDRFECEARETLITHWAVVDALAKKLFASHSMCVTDVNEFITSKFLEREVLRAIKSIQRHCEQSAAIQSHHRYWIAALRSQ